MASADSGYNPLKPDVTDSKGNLTAESSILRCLKVADTHLQPKIIANRSRIPYNTVKVTLRRLAQKNLVMQDGTGYFLPQQSFEHYLEAELMREGQKESLPKIHDIHLTFRTENIRKVMSHPEMIESFQSKFEYAPTDREPDDKEFRNSLIDSYQNIASLSEGSFLNRFFNPLDELSIYQMWRNLAPYHQGRKSNFREIKGGIQETFDFITWKLIVQVYDSTGTIKVIFSNSEHPFDAIQFREALMAVNGVFAAKTGACFMDIAPFFYFEKVHFGNDLLGDREYSGTTRLNCTVKQLDDWLFRTYEKVLGDDLYIRNETCLERGSFEDHNLNAMLALIEGGTNPTLVTAQLYKTNRNQQDNASQIAQLSRQMEQLYKMMKILVQEKISAAEGHK